MTLTQQIEALFEKHGLRRIHQGMFLGGHACSMGFCSTRASLELIPELVALLTPQQPDREVLREKIKTMHAPLTANCWCRDKGFSASENELVDWLVAWATSQEPKPWCQHIGRWDGRWQLPREDGSFILIQDDWDRCPVKGCGHPRPEAP